MNCKRAIRRMLESGDLDGEAAVHVEHCRDCQDAASTAAMLEDLGRSESKAEMTEDKIRETRWRAKALLAERAERRPIVLGAIWIWRRAGAFAAAAALVAALFFGIVRMRRDADGIAPVPAGAGELANIDRRIENLMDGIRHDLGIITGGYPHAERESVAMSRVEGLRTSMELCALHLMEELGYAAGRVDDGRRRQP